MTELETGFRLSDIIGLLRRRSAFVAGAAVIGLVVGVIAFTTSPPNYSATARVQVTALSAGTGTGPTAPTVVDIGTERDLVKSDAVADAVRAKLKLEQESNKEIFTGVTVTAGQDSAVLEITTESASATRARDISNATANAYLAQRRSGVQDNVDRLTKQLDEANQARTEAMQAVDKATTSAEKLSASNALADANATQRDVKAQLAAAGDPATAGGSVSKLATLPTAVLSKMALAKGVGVFGLFVLAGLGLALLVDRRDSLGGGRRAVSQLVPNANMRMMPTATSRKPGPAEIDAAIDRLAVELIGGTGSGPTGSVLVVGTGNEPPVALAEELASSLTFAGIPALFVLAGSAEREVRGAHVVTSFADLITGPSVTGPASLPEVAGAPATTAPATVTWLRPRGSAEASGLLRRAVIEALVLRAGREGFDAVVFVAATPTRNAAAAALGQWVRKTAVIVDDEDGPAVEAAVRALVEADVHINEVVWT